MQCDVSAAFWHVCTHGVLSRIIGKRAKKYPIQDQLKNCSLVDFCSFKVLKSAVNCHVNNNILYECITQRKPFLRVAEVPWIKEFKFPIKEKMYGY